MPKAKRQRSSALTINKRDDGKLDVSKTEAMRLKRELSGPGVVAVEPDKPDKIQQSKIVGANSTIDRTDREDTAALSRGQKKRQAKREKYLKRERMVMSSLKLKKQDEQAKRIDGLDALKEALLETMSMIPEKDKDKTRPTQIVRSNRAKLSIVRKETEHMKLVLEHPSFKANPLAAIHEHLKNTTSQATSEEQSKPIAIKAKPKKKKKSRFRATRMKNR